MIFENVDNVANAVVDLLVKLADFAQFGKCRAFVSVEVFLLVSSLECLCQH